MFSYALFPIRRSENLSLAQNRGFVPSFIRSVRIIRLPLSREPIARAFSSPSRVNRFVAQSILIDAARFWTIRAPKNPSMVLVVATNFPSFFPSRTTVWSRLRISIPSPIFFRFSSLTCLNDRNLRRWQTIPGTCFICSRANFTNLVFWFFQFSISLSFLFLSFPPPFSLLFLNFWTFSLRRAYFCSSQGGWLGFLFAIVNSWFLYYHWKRETRWNKN